MTHGPFYKESTSMVASKRTRETESVKERVIHVQQILQSSVI